MSLVYVALISLKSRLEGLIDYFDVCLTPPSLKIAEYLYKEVKSFQEFLKSLDDHSSRKRMDVSLRRTRNAIGKFNIDIFLCHLEKQVGPDYENVRDAGNQFSIDLAEIQQDIHSLIETMKKTKEKYFNGLLNPVQEEEEDDGDDDDEEEEEDGDDDDDEEEEEEEDGDDGDEEEEEEEEEEEDLNKSKEAGIYFFFYLLGIQNHLQTGICGGERIGSQIMSVPAREEEVSLDIDFGRNKSKMIVFFALFLLELQTHSEVGRKERIRDQVQTPIARVGKMVGLCDQYDRLKETISLNWIENEDFHLSLVGMAGIGKTTLAKKLFQDLDILELFDCRVWVTVGKECPLNEIPLAILLQVDPDMHYVSMLIEGDEKTGKYLKKSLRHKRYLIVLDDVWDTKVYSHLERFLPQNSGSTILLTTRAHEVAEEFCAKSNSCYELDIRLLNKDESWHLFCEEVFGQESCCPSQLEKVGKKIVEKCDGLPLAIIMVANLISKAERTLEYWNGVATRRKHQIFNDAHNEISKVLYTSYEHLTQQLKSCLLYIGVFPEYSKVPRSKLINLWIAEGLLKPAENQTLEDCGLKILEELVSNTLVMVYKRSTIGSIRKEHTQGIKTCGLHSSWWHLCLREATKTNFLYALNSCEDSLGEGIKNQSRLCIHNNVLLGIKDVYNSIKENFASTSSSLLFFGPYHQYPVPVYFGLRLLQHLDALNIRFYEFPMEVLELVWLKYLALTYNGNLPLSISTLWKLQFLIVNRHLNIKSCGVLSYMPMEIWDMRELKHLQVMGSDLQDRCGGRLLPNLLTLVNVSAHSCTKGIHERIPNLKKLGIRIEIAPDHAIEPLSYFDHLSYLKKLETLKYVIANPKPRSEVIPPPTLSILPLNLKKITLSGLGCPWKEMSMIASLEHLEVLKLRSNAFQGPKWEIEEDRFLKLKHLLIEDMTDLEQMKVGLESFMRLEYLSIQQCYKLKELHWKFGSYISKIVVSDCNPLIVKQIKEARLISRATIEDFSVHSSWKDGNLNS